MLKRFTSISDSCRLRRDIAERVHMSNMMVEPDVGDSKMNRVLNDLTPGDFFLYEGKVYIKSSSVTDSSIECVEQWFIGEAFPYRQSFIKENCACLDMLTGELFSIPSTERIVQIAVDLVIHKDK